MSLFFRRLSIGGRFPFVRLLQIRDNPAFLFHILLKNLVHRRLRTDWAPRYAPFSFLSGAQTLNALIANGQSLARFSDGEIGLLTGCGIYPPDSDWCQRWSKPLERDLAAALSSTDPRLMVAVEPPSTFLASRDSVHPIRFEYNMWTDTRRLLWKYLNARVAYGHCHLFIRENCPDLDWNQLRDHLRRKDVIVATGNVRTLQHLNPGRRTFFIECGTENAYEKKESIRAAILGKVATEGLDKKDVLVMASLGPTAGILAHEMLDTGICLWDTGHIFEFAAKGFIESVFNAQASSAAEAGKKPTAQASA